MLQRIRDCARCRPWIAIAAAYAVALQMMLGGLGGVSSAGRDAFSIICQSGGGSGNEGRGSSLPEHHTICVLCAVAHVPVFPNGGRAADAVAAATDSVLIPLPPDDLLVAILVLRGNYARGPPGAEIAG